MCTWLVKEGTVSATHSALPRCGHQRVARVITKSSQKQNLSSEAFSHTTAPPTQSTQRPFGLPASTSLALGAPGEPGATEPGRRLGTSDPDTDLFLFAPNPETRPRRRGPDGGSEHKLETEPWALPPPEAGPRSGSQTADPVGQRDRGRRRTPRGPWREFLEEGPICGDKHHTPSHTTWFHFILFISNYCILLILLPGKAACGLKWIVKSQHKSGLFPRNMHTHAHTCSHVYHTPHIHVHVCTPHTHVHTPHTRAHNAHVCACTCSHGYAQSHTPPHVLTHVACPIYLRTPTQVHTHVLSHHSTRFPRFSTSSLCFPRSGRLV